jgi:hypothetical protein
MWLPEIQKRKTRKRHRQKIKSKIARRKDKRCPKSKQQRKGYYGRFDGFIAAPLASTGSAQVAGGVMSAIRPQRPLRTRWDAIPVCHQIQKNGAES